MFENFNLDYYKNYLVSFFKYEVDNSEVKKNERRKYLEQSYSDEELLEIIENTKEFIMELIQKITADDTPYISIMLTISLKYISTNCCGGFQADTLIPVDEYDEGKFISQHLLKMFLGRNIFVETRSEEIDVWDEVNDTIVGCIYEYPRLVIHGNFKELIGRYKENMPMVRTLKPNE